MQAYLPAFLIGGIGGLGEVEHDVTKIQSS